MIIHTIIEEFTYTHEYGSLWINEYTDNGKTKNLYKRTYIKMACIFGFALCFCFCWVISFISFFLFSFGGSENKEKFYNRRKKHCFKFCSHLFLVVVLVLFVLGLGNMKKTLLFVSLWMMVLFLFCLLSSFRSCQNVRFFNQLEQKSN